MLLGKVFSVCVVLCAIYNVYSESLYCEEPLKAFIAESPCILWWRITLIQGAVDQIGKSSLAGFRPRRNLAAMSPCAGCTVTVEDRIIGLEKQFQSIHRNS